MTCTSRGVTRGAISFLIGVGALALAACSSAPASPPSPSEPSQDGSFAQTPEEAGSSGMGDASGDGGSPVEAGTDPFAGLSACPTAQASGDFPPEVAAVLRAKCQTCHKKPPINHAPFPLQNYEDTVAPDPIAPYAGRPIWQAMHAVIQPAGVPHMPLGKAPQLTAAEMQALDGWLTSCATPVAEGTGGDVDSAQVAADAATETHDATPE